MGRVINGQKVVLRCIGALICGFVASPENRKPIWNRIIKGWLALFRRAGDENLMHAGMMLKAGIFSMLRRRPDARRRIHSVLARADLDEDRRLALLLLSEVAELGGLEAYPQATELDVTRLLREFGSNFACVNCSKETTDGMLYCDELCKQIAKAVRYIRGCAADGRVWKPDVQSAIGVRLLMLTGGGYPAAARKIPNNVREMIFARDGRRCVICAETATEIDHIDGDLCDPANLRAVCGRCNRRLAFACASETTPDEKETIIATYSDIARRVASPEPLQACDHVNWKNSQPKIRSVRVRLWRQASPRAA